MRYLAHGVTATAQSASRWPLPNPPRQNPRLRSANTVKFLSQRIVLTKILRPSRRTLFLRGHPPRGSMPKKILILLKQTQQDLLPKRNQLRSHLVFSLIVMMKMIKVIHTYHPTPNPRCRKKLLLHPNPAYRKEAPRNGRVMTPRMNRLHLARRVRSQRRNHARPHLLRNQLPQLRSLRLSKRTMWSMTLPKRSGCMFPESLMSQCWSL
jgi:hypothetical protein